MAESRRLFDRAAEALGSLPVKDPTPPQTASLTAVTRTRTAQSVTFSYRQIRIQEGSLIVDTTAGALIAATVHEGSLTASVEEGSGT